MGAIGSRTRARARTGMRTWASWDRGGRIGVTVADEGIVMTSLSDTGVYQYTLEFVLIIFWVRFSNTVLLVVFVAYRGVEKG